MKSKVSIVKCPDYEYSRVYSAVKKSIDLIGGLDQLHQYGKKVLLKPNMLFGVSPEKAITTHPVFVEAVITLFKEHGFELTAGDSPGLDSPQQVCKKTGIEEIMKRQNVPLGDFSTAVETPNPDGVLVKRFQIVKAALEADFIVSLPKLKTHSMMYYTGAMKNLFGTIHGMNKAKFHLRYPTRKNFSQMIVDLVTLLKPRLSIMDSITAMEGDGPSNGTPKNLGIILASMDVLALDTTACKIIGYQPENIPILAEAVRRKNPAWINSFEEIDVVGENISSVSPASFNKIRILSDIGFIKKIAPGFIFSFIQNLMVPRPFFSKQKCIRCGRCIEICPAQALAFKEAEPVKKVVVEYNKCIRCYCCHEMCPADAIVLRNF